MAPILQLTISLKGGDRQIPTTLRMFGRRGQTRTKSLDINAEVSTFLEAKGSEDNEFALQGAGDQSTVTATPRLRTASVILRRYAEDTWAGITCVQEGKEYPYLDLMKDIERHNE